VQLWRGISDRGKAKRLVIAVSALSLLAMPVTYRGGAEQAHPHMFLQLWIDAEQGSFDHHHAIPVPGHAHVHTAPKPSAGASQGNTDGPSLTNLLIPEVHGLAVAAWAVLVFVVLIASPVWRERFMIPTGRLLQPDFPPPRRAEGIA